MSITWENYEEYMMMYADGELQAEEVHALMAFIDEHPQLKRELAAYERVQMIADTALVYADKESLKKKAPAKRTIALLTWKNAALAAGVAAIIVLSFYRFNTDNVTDKHANAVAINKAPDAVVMPMDSSHTAAVTNGPDTIQKNTVAAAQEEQKKAVKELNNVKHEQHTLAAAKHSVGKHNQVIAVPETQQVTIVKHTERIEVAPIAAGKELIAKPQQHTLQAVADVPVYAMSEPEKNASLWDRLPLDEANKEGIKSIKDAGTAVAAVYDKIEEVKKQIHNTSVYVRIEQRKLIVSF